MTNLTCHYTPDTFTNPFSEVSPQHDAFREGVTRAIRDHLSAAHLADTSQTAGTAALHLAADALVSQETADAAARVFAYWSGVRIASEHIVASRRG